MERVPPSAEQVNELGPILQFASLIEAQMDAGQRAIFRVFVERAGWDKTKLRRAAAFGFQSLHSREKRKINHEFTESAYRTVFWPEIDSLIAEMREHAQGNLLQRAQSKLPELL
jgi:hypothetical protein